MTDVYMYQAALYCAECGEAIREELTKAGQAPPEPDDESSYDSDDFPKGPFADGGGEADSPQHCDACSVFLENPLTGDGEAYVQECIERNLIEGRLSEAATEWSAFYGIEPRDPKAIRFGRMTPEIREMYADKETGELEAYAWPGGYPMFYVAGGSEVVCVKCANDHETGLGAFGSTYPDGDCKIDGADANWEDPDLYCECGERIPSAYAEDEANELDDVNDDDGQESEGKDGP